MFYLINYPSDLFIGEYKSRSKKVQEAVKITISVTQQESDLLSEETKIVKGLAQCKILPMAPHRCRVFEQPRQKVDTPSSRPAYCSESRDSCQKAECRYHY